MDNFLKVEDCFKYEIPRSLAEAGHTITSNITVRDYEVLRDYVLKSVNDIKNLLKIHEGKIYNNEENIKSQNESLKKSIATLPNLNTAPDPFFPQKSSDDVKANNDVTIINEGVVIINNL